MTRVTAPSRLHFGLLSLPAAGSNRWPGIDGQPGLPVRHFGGVGLMVDRPGLAVSVERARDWSATGPHAERTLGFARQFVSALSLAEQIPFHVTVEHAPPEHTGLGVGTQLGLAVAKAIAVELGRPELATPELAFCVGRGERSAIGVHGFNRGGLIVEAGKRPDDAVSPLVAHVDFPSEWAVVLVAPPGSTSWHGSRERQAFAKLAEVGPSPAETDVLCRLVLTGLLPAIATRDLHAFGEALYEFNARAGDAFAAVQGGRYAGPAVAACVAKLRMLGLTGVGQSSWGPSVFAIVDRHSVPKVLAQMPDAPAVVAGASRGAIVN
ncbi:MAG TPA: beta-ribofuranosylaminobenzene 5'-phosphate synthase family protein [Gemmataceae bacterium]|jgi:beta-RFAP synthase|nr:beta-ribofuranosylaminobenzene 5'-phosphate synthase family protein [Gemmataceae bacterium]